MVDGDGFARGDADDGGALGIPGYDQVEEIGRGGFGVVYRARQRDLDRTVAVKVLTAVADDRSQARFDRERRALGALSDHPSIVTIYESGTTRQGLPFLTMEHLAGGSLADRLQQRGPVPWPTAVSWIVTVCGAVETAHRIGVLHRDIKPENILLDRRDQARLADFGIAGHLAGTATATGSITASIGHAAPEVLAGQRATAAADVYSLGSTLFALLAGAAAFVRPTDETLMPVVVRVSCEPVPDLRPAGVPDEVCVAIEAAMAKEAAARPASAVAFGEALQAALTRHGHAAVPMVIEAVTVEPPTGSGPVVVGSDASAPGAPPIVAPVGLGWLTGPGGAGAGGAPAVAPAGAPAGATVSASTGPGDLTTPGKAGAHLSGAADGGRLPAKAVGRHGPEGGVRRFGRTGRGMARRARLLVGAGVATVTAVAVVGGSR